MFEPSKLIPKSVDSQCGQEGNVTDIQDVTPDVKSLVKFLEKRYGVVSEIHLDSNSVIKCLYFQDSFMKDIFNFYPDRLCIDVSYKYFETDIFMYIFLCEDSNGRFYIIAFGFLQSDDFESLTWLFGTFKKHNPNWRRTKLLAVDPQIKQQDIVRSNFPHPYTLISFYHACKSFRIGLDKLKNLISIEQKQIASNLFKSMCMAYGPTEYELYFQQFLMLHGSIVSYFQEVWVPIQFLWRPGLDYHENILSSLNFYLERMDNKIKSVFMLESNLVELVKKLFFILSLIRKEKSNANLQTVPMLYSQFSPEHHISKVLTPYASKFVINQLDMSTEIIMELGVLSDSYIFEYLGTSVSASSSICSCHFYLYTFLPCRHIFAVRKLLALCIFEETLCDFTWTNKYYENNNICMKSNESNTVLPYKSGSKLSTISYMFESVLPSFLESPESVFDSQFEVLNELIKSWKSDGNVYLQFVGVEKNRFCSNHSVFSPEIILSPEKEKENLKPVKSCTESYIKQDADIQKSRLISKKASRQAKWNFKSDILNGKNINYAYLCRTICHTKESCVEWLRKMDLLPSSFKCPSCGCEMCSKSFIRLSDGAVWVCPNILENKKCCSKKCSVRCGSWFELTNMTLEQILTFCYMWVNGFSQSQIVSETGISTGTYTAWNKFNKRICDAILIEDNIEYRCSKSDPSSSNQALDSWMQKYEGEDTFLRFLQDASRVHQRDSKKFTV